MRIHIYESLLNVVYSVLEPTPVRQEASIKLTLLFGCDVLVPEPVLIVVKVDRHEMLVGLVIGVFNFIKTSIFLGREVSQALLLCRVKLVLFDSVLVLVDPPTIFLGVCFAHLLHHPLNHASVFCRLFLINTSAHEHSVELLLSSIIVAIILRIGAQVGHINDVEIQLAHHFLSVGDGYSPLVR